MKNISPMCIEFWLTRINPITNAFYTVDEAKNHIKSFRKSNLEYWLTRGYSLDDAKKLRHDYQVKACKRGIQEKRLHPEYEQVHIEYWLVKGYSENEARKKLHERQSTFSYNKCIKKYGKKKGQQIFNDRQKKWQNTLNNKTNVEKVRINKKKNIYLYFYDKKRTRDDLFWADWKKVCERHHLKYIDNIVDAQKEIETLFKNTVCILGKSINWFIKYSCPKYLYKVLNISESQVKTWLKNLNFNFQKIYKVNGQYQPYHMLLNNGNCLVSSLEIKFYNMLIQKDLKIEATNEHYPNSKMRFDFRVEGKYIEIAGLLSKKTYKNKMMYKRDTFNCFVLRKENEFANFIQKVLIENDEKTIQYYLTRRL